MSTLLPCPRFASAAARIPGNVAPANILLTPNVRASLPADFLSQLQNALAQSLFWVYLLALVLAVIGLGTMFLLPGGRADKYAYKPAEGEASEDAEEVETHAPVMLIE